MAKRYEDSQKYRKPFLRGLEGVYKLFWDFICCECDHAGIWIVDFELTNFLLGKGININQEEAMRQFNKDETKIIEVDQGKKWFIPSFIDFQYNVLTPGNKVHDSVIKILIKNGLYNKNEGLVRPLVGAKDKDKDKDKDSLRGRGESEGRGRKPKGKCLFKNSGVTVEDLKEAFQKTEDITNADPKSYFTSAFDWSESNNGIKSDWIATIRIWARKDFRDGKLVLKKSNKPLINF